MPKTKTKTKPPTRLAAALVKYIEAQRVLLKWSSMDDMWVLTAYGAVPAKLYKHMQESGFVWDRGLQTWRLRIGRYEPRRYGDYE